MSNMSEMIGMIIAALVGALIAYVGAKKLPYNTIHESTNWRTELMKIASSKDITLNDIYRIRASVYSTSNGAYQTDKLAIHFFDYMIEKYGYHNENYSTEDKEYTRILCRGLLHINWIYNTRSFKYQKVGQSKKVYQNVLNELLFYKTKKVEDNKFIKYVTDEVALFNQ